MANTEITPGMFTPQNRSVNRVRRNLSAQFTDETNSPEMYVNSPDELSPSDSSLIEGNATNSESGNWKKVIIATITFVLITGILVGFMYVYYPVYLLICLTSEFMTAFVASVLLVIFGYIVFLIWSNSSARTLNNDYTMSPSSVSPAWKRNVPSTPKVINNLPIGSSTPSQQLAVKRTFSGGEIWSEFIRYYENIATLNGWAVDRKIGVFFTVLRDQAETFAYGLPGSVRYN